MKLFLAVFVFLASAFVVKSETDYGFMPTKCEICALVSIEFEQQSAKVHNSYENTFFVSQIVLMSILFQRLTSEFADLTEKICEGFNEFKIHKEKSGLERFSRAPSKTMETLKEMRNKGVKVELGMPYEMWDQPPAEIIALRQGCESILEDYEDLIEEWFLQKLHLKHLLNQLCSQNYIKRGDRSCYADIVEEKEL
ncbi:hypothetical protein B9Z55_026379 [Caenorhabditis nigoni]|uniref:DUF3456 domain-containing protein n=1 Tax=Caenorhabditis nigoni TaxID=1611254 RepID=A0A2G5T2H5_9PELO|nr:hypothetical protein B9Z55_026379 [Caenorhabditis nigoni]